MWDRLKNLLGNADPAAETPAARPSAAPHLFHRYYCYPEVFEFNMSKLDINLLVYPDSAERADRDVVLLLVFGYEEIFKVADVNEAYVCRKLGEIKDKVQGRNASFDAVLAQTRRVDAQSVVDACVRDGDLDRTGVEAGGDLRLTPDARERMADLAAALNRQAMS